jgi:uncharacterized protein
MARGIFALLLLSLSALAACRKAAGSDAAPSMNPAVVLPDGFAVRVELALTPEEHARGLMFVKDLPPDRGMLFLFDSAEIRPFWMKDCFISLDMIWLDKENRVVDITRKAQPCQEDPCPNFYPAAPALNVLEVQGGLSAAHGLAPGDVLTFVDVPAGPR